MTAQQRELCSLCGRQYTKTSKPRWAFTEDGQLIGSVHTSCGQRGSYIVVGYVRTMHPEAARLRFWLETLQHHSSGDNAQNIPSLYAQSLIGNKRPSPILDQRQNDLLPRWETRRKNPLLAHEIAGVRIAYRDLIRDFWTWNKETHHEIVP